MKIDRKKTKELARLEARQERRRKKNALVRCRDGKEFWTTQKQFWQWIRENTIVKTADSPLTGLFLRDHEEYQVVLSNTILNLRCPNHLSEVLSVRRRVMNQVDR
jgi:hypothetical protein